MSRKRVVVTGLSAVTPIGNDVETSWKNLTAGVSGIAPCTRVDTSEYATQFCGEVKDFDVSPYIPPKQARRLEYFIKYAIACGKMLMDDSGYCIPEDKPQRTGVIIGCGLGGLQTIEETHAALVDKGPRRVSPFFIPVAIANMAGGMVAVETGAKGPNLASCSACTSGTHGIGTAFSEILLGRCDAMICGGVESTITGLAFTGFNSMKALSTRNDEPTRASRPFDKDRDGFVIGEGCGLLLLEELESAKARGAKIYAELVGYGASADAYHMTAPPEDGSGMALAMQAALDDAGVPPEVVGCINAHGTSTPLNDLCETRAIKKVFGDHAYKLNVTGNKSMIGHLLGGAGGVEGVFSVMTLKDGVIPGTINHENPGDECDLDYTASGSVEKPVEYVLSNSFGFGGTNGSVLFKRWDD